MLSRALNTVLAILHWFFKCFYISHNCFYWIPDKSKTKTKHSITFVSDKHMWDLRKTFQNIDKEIIYLYIGRLIKTELSEWKHVAWS